MVIYISCGNPTKRRAQSATSAVLSNGLIVCRCVFFTDEVYSLLSSNRSSPNVLRNRMQIYMQYKYKRDTFTTTHAFVSLHWKPELKEMVSRSHRTKKAVKSVTPHSLMFNLSTLTKCASTARYFICHILHIPQLSHSHTQKNVLGPR